jgi:hypothetical protein
LFTNEAPEIANTSTATAVSADSRMIVLRLLQNRRATR